jgi:hypothetical protein
MVLYAPKPVRSATLGIPVQAMQARFQRILSRGLAGVMVVLLIVFLVVVFGGLDVGIGALLSLLLVGAALGAATARWGLIPPEVRQLNKELRREDLVMVLDVPDDRLGKIEQTIQTRHPEIRVKGTDPRGSPPFP